MTTFAALTWPLYLSAALLLAAGAAASWLPRPIGPMVGPTVFSGGLLALTASVAGRWLQTGRPPVMGTFENAMVAAWMLTVLAIVLGLAGPFAGRVTLLRLVAPWAPLLLAFGSRFQRSPMRLDAAGRSLLGYAHAFIGWAAFAILVAAAMAALGLLVTRRDSEDGALFDQALSRLLGAGFTLLTATMATGAAYSVTLFSELFRWQVVEAFAAASWIACALVLHNRLMFGWRGRRFAWAAAALQPLVFAAFWIWSVYPGTYHYFERALIPH